jgi:hypothetical protein
MIDDEDIPRCQKLDGTTLLIVRQLSPDPNHVAITDGERTAIYVLAPSLPTESVRYDDRLANVPSTIVPSYTEGGWPNA